MTSDRGASAAAAADDDDPVLASYSVFVKPPLPANRKLMVLQYPNNHSEDPATLQTPPVTEIRVKPGSGMIEADVPIDYNRQYDRFKGMNWGAALQKSLAAKGGGSLGLAGGFGLGAPPPKGRRPGAGADDDVEGGDWAEAVRLDKVLRTQTLGGLSAPVTDARYMVGVFQGKNIHLTPVSSLVHLRPQMHYLDATTEQERLSRASGANAAAAASGAKEAGAAARAIHMTIKSATADGEEVVTETIADRLRAVQVEGWRRMEYADEDTVDAWAAYQECLFLRPEGVAPPPPLPEDGAGGEGAGEGKVSAEADASGAADLGSRVPRLGTGWDEDKMLRAVSGIKAHDKKPGEEAVTEAAAAAAGGVSRGKGKGTPAPAPVAEAVAEPRRRITRPAANRAGREKAGLRGSGADNAMELD